MLFHRHLSHLQRLPSRPRVVTVGAYDGVHLGHQGILQQLQSSGRAAGLPTLVLSFEPLPREFFSPDRPAARLTRFRERFHLLARLGVDELFCPSFSRIRHLSAREFIEDVLLAALNTNHVVVGEGFRFAAKRLGTMQDLRKAGAVRGFEVTEVPGNLLARPASQQYRHPRCTAQGRSDPCAGYAGQGLFHLRSGDPGDRPGQATGLSHSQRQP